MTFVDLARSILTPLLLAALLAGCSNNLVPPQKQSIRAIAKVDVKDPLLRNITQATDTFELKASGVFHPGVYVIKNTSVHVDPNTKFTIELTVKIDDPAVISTENADGKLVTSVPLVIKGVSLPTSISLHHGTVSGDVDVAQTLGAFFLTVLTNQDLGQSNTDDTRKMVQTAHVEKAALRLKPGSTLNFGKKSIHVGKDSAIELTDVDVDSDLNYRGSALFDINFLKDSKWIGESCDVDFNGGQALVKLQAERKQNVFTLTLKEPHQALTLTDCLIRWGKNKGSFARSVRGLMSLDELTWQRKDNSADAALHLLATMTLENTHLDLITDTQETNAQFVEKVPCQLQVDIDDQGHRSTQFATHTTEVASTARIDIKRPTTNLSIYLENAKVGPIAVDKTGRMEFSLDKGTAKLKQLDWSSAKRTFTLCTAGASLLSLPNGMELSTSGKAGGAKMTLPVVLKLGNATLKGSKSEMKLSKLDGKMVITVDPDVRISSDMDFSFEKFALVDGRKADVKARGFDLQAEKGRAIATIKTCEIDWPQGTLGDALRKQMPTSKVFEPHKLIQNQKWRYRNAVIEKVTLTHLDIDHLQSSGVNGVDFTVSGDVDVNGTIEKGGLLSTLMHTDSKHWETRPWTASGHCTGSGKVTYKLIAGNSLASSVLAYSVKMKLPIPDDVQLDWSQVSGALIGSAEKAIILSYMKKLDIPLDLAGKINVGGATDSQFDNVKISHLHSEPSDKGTKLTFSAQAIF
jgi:hypothetical protein